MKALLRFGSLIVSLGLGLIGASAHAASGVGPYYATPSWDQTLPASTRFLVLTNMNNEAVLDRETGLVWEQSPSTLTFNWVFASSHCLILNKGGRTGWRLPAMPELMSLADQSQRTPALPVGHPFSVGNSFYWSATTYLLDTGDAWVVEFVNGGPGNINKSGGGVNVRAWCVRGGPGGDTQ